MIVHQAAALSSQSRRIWESVKNSKLDMEGGRTCIHTSMPSACPPLHYNDMQVFKEAQDLMPGGVNSPVRAFRSVGGSPIIFESVKVSTAWCFQQQLDSSVNRALA